MHCEIHGCCKWSIRLLLLSLVTANFNSSKHLPMHLMTEGRLQTRTILLGSVNVKSGANYNATVTVVQSLGYF